MLNGDPPTLPSISLGLLAATLVPPFFDANVNVMFAIAFCHANSKTRCEIFAVRNFSSTTSKIKHAKYFL